MKKKKKTIVLCSSVAFYKQLLEIEKELKKAGFLVKVPDAARKMEKTKDFDEKRQKTWYGNKKDYHIKTKLMANHFKKIVEGDAILVINLEKNGHSGYIGANVLLEIGIAFHYNRPIYVLNPILEELISKEEIYGMNPIFLNGDLSQLFLQNI